MKKLFYLFTPLVLGSIIGFIINPFMDYSSLVKPPLAPPSIVFPIAWTIIYILLGISYYIYKKSSLQNKFIDIVYYSSLGINLLWSIIFFVLKWRFFAVVWIILLLISILYLLSLLWTYNKKSVYLNIPYVIWVTFATYLTIGIYLLN